jgi:S1-C subfamily serine protease
MPQEPSVSSTWQSLSNEAASTMERAGRSVVAVHARRRIPASGVHWRPGIVVTANHAVDRDDEITVTLPDQSTAPATLAGRDPATDLAILKISGENVPVAELGEAAALKPGNLVLVAGRTAEGTSRASLAMIAVTGPAWRAWTGGALDQILRLDRNLHPNLSGGPLIDSAGRILGINTPTLSRFTATVIPASTVDRVTAELEKRGHIGRGYFGVGMQPIPLPQKLRESLKLTNKTGVMIITVEPDGPAEKAGVLIGDILVALDSEPVSDTDDVQAHLTSEHVGKAVKVSLIRGGALTDATMIVGAHPAGDGSRFRGRGWRRGHGHFPGR